MILASLFCLGLWVSFRPGMILSKVPKWFVQLLYKECSIRRADLIMMLKKPLFDCLPCMASIWGTLFYFMADGGNYFVFIFSLVGLNFIVKKLIDLID